MAHPVRFDFIAHDYSVLADATLQPHEKAPDIRGKTDAIIKQLFACTISHQTLETTYKLAIFTHQLSNHVQASLKRRYGIFSWFIIVIGKTLGIGSLGQLEALERSFKSSCNRQKDAHILALQKATSQEIPKLLGSIFLVDPAATSGNKKVDARYSQIKKPGLFPPSECIQLAWHIEHHAQMSARIKKDQSIHFPRSLHCDTSTGRIFISHKGNKQPPIAATGVKKVTKALMIDPADEKATVVAQITTQDTLRPHMRQATLNEYHTTHQYKDSPGIWPILHATQYIKHKDNTAIEKVALFAPLGESTFSNIAHILPFDEFVQITHKLLEGLQTIHASGAVHADIKGANALVTRKEDGPADVGWIDFGLSGKITDERLINHFKSGFYGTLKCTAPELLGVQGFCGDYAKTDMWAFGLMLYRSYFKKNPDWFERKLVPAKREGIDYKKKNDYKMAIQTEIEPALTRLFENEPKTRATNFEMLIYKMLLPDPKKRLSAQEALCELQAL